MEQILNGPRQGRPSGPKDRKETAAAAAVLLRRHLRRILQRGEDVLSKCKLGRVSFLVAATLVGLIFLLTTVYAPSYFVTVDGTEVGVVHSKAEFQELVSAVETQASGILGYDYQLEVTPAYQFQLTEKNSFTSAASVRTFLFDQVGEVLKSYVLTVDGNFVGAATDRAVLDGILNEITSAYTTENTVSTSFFNDVSIVREYTPADILTNTEDIYAALTANTTGETDYTVVSGDTFNAIAYEHDMSASDLKALNPDVDPDKLNIGQTLTIQKREPLLSVSTTDRVSYTESIACPKEEQKDASMYVGDSKVITQGVPGEAAVTADVTYVNGYEDSREVLSYTVTREPTTTVVAVGTKERPKTMASGSLRWPCSGRLSSYFGRRTLLGTTRAHTGIDIAASYGTAIVAADGGTVTYSGWKSGYGYLIIINHGNGMQTYYGHCSSLVVSAGTKVYKGQTVARVGSTGRSTGNHCHFEVRINGTAVNPLSYLP